MTHEITKHDSLGDALRNATLQTGVTLSKGKKNEDATSGSFTLIRCLELAGSSLLNGEVTKPPKLGTLWISFRLSMGKDKHAVSPTGLRRVKFFFFYFLKG